MSKHKPDLAQNISADDESALPEASPTGEAISGLRDSTKLGGENGSAGILPASKDSHSSAERTDHEAPATAGSENGSAGIPPASKDPHSSAERTDREAPATADGENGSAGILPASKDPHSSAERTDREAPATADVSPASKDPPAGDDHDSRIRIALKIEYDGTKFCGSQMQSGVRTVQEDLEKALGAFFRSKDRIVLNPSGRTDSGVHASGQVAHFDITPEQLTRAFKKHESQTEVQVSLDQEALRQICLSLNGILKEDISVVAAQQVPLKFHSRFKAIRRTYVYRILNRPQRTALGYNAQYFVHSSLNIANMQAAARALLGTHDFSAFKSSNADDASPICTVNRAELLNYGEGKLEFWISADHFVYNMVRIIVGTLVDIGLGKREPSDLSYALTEKGRNLAGPTAPALGLCLHQVDYPAEFNLFQRGSQEEPNQEI